MSEDLERKARSLGIRSGARSANRGVSYWIDDGRRREYRAWIAGASLHLSIDGKERSRDFATDEAARKKLQAHTVEARRAYLIELQRLVKRAEAAQRKAQRAAGKAPPRAPATTLTAFRLAGAKPKLAVVVRSGLRLVTLTVTVTPAGMSGLRVAASAFSSTEARDGAAQKKAAAWARLGFKAHTLTAGQKRLFTDRAKREGGESPPARARKTR